MDRKPCGLCLNCARHPNCSLTLNRGRLRDVRYCEEYEASRLPAAVPSPDMTFERPVRSPSRRVLGLCGNCDNYPTCGFPKPEAGVWHCEEYR